MIGRGLRRRDYDVDPDGYFLRESCDIYGIPFEVLPIAKVGTSAGAGRTMTAVKSLPERRRDHEILFPASSATSATSSTGSRSTSTRWSRLP